MKASRAMPDNGAVVVRLVPVAFVLALVVVLSAGSATGCPLRERRHDLPRAFAVQVAVPGQAGGSAASVVRRPRTRSASAARSPTRPTAPSSTRAR